MIFKGIEICCPHCKGELEQMEQPDPGLMCLLCGQRFPVILDIPDLRVFPDPYIEMEADRAKGLRVAARFGDLNFAELVDYYYSITPAVPAKHAQQYTKGLLTGEARAKNALTSWEKAAGTNEQYNSMTLLEVGCGTAPLLVAAAPSFKKFVGIDISFRWLVVAKKRLAEAGLDLPLICACAEALPFPDGAFDRVVADSVIEHVKDQKQAMAECYRVMRQAGNLYLATPNHYSPGPDPHVGIWAGSLLPNYLLTAYVRWQGGIPPKRRLLSVGSLVKLIRSVGFSSIRIQLPDIPEAQLQHLNVVMKALVWLYQVGKNLPISRQLLRLIGPMFHAVAQKPRFSKSPQL